MKILNTKQYILLLLAFTCQTVFSESYWVSPDGNRFGKGTESDPVAYMAFENFIKKTGGGHTFIFKPGNYIGRQLTLYPEQKGTSQNPTVLKSQEKYKARIHGSTGHNIYVLKGCDWTIIDGFRVSGALIDGIKCNSDYSAVRNCWIHNNAHQGLGAHSVNNFIIERNLIEFNGNHIQYDHGIYADGNNLKIRSNVIRYNASRGIHLTGTVTNCTIVNNLCHNNTREGIIVWTEPNQSGSNNIVNNNTIADNGLGIHLSNPKGTVIVNNIISNNTHYPHDMDNNLSMINGQYSDIKCFENLIIPLVPEYANGNFSANPGFFASRKGIYYLVSSSPARSKANKEYLPNKDFWDCSRNMESSPDLGCFPYDQALLEDEYKENWLNEWPFYYPVDPPKIPDLWKVPGQ